MCDAAPKTGGAGEILIHVDRVVFPGQGGVAVDVVERDEARRTAQHGAGDEILEPDLVGHDARSASCRRRQSILLVPDRGSESAKAIWRGTL